MDAEVRFMYKHVKNIKYTRQCMEPPGMHMLGPRVYYEDNEFCISFVKDKQATPRVKNIYILVWFLQGNLHINNRL